MDGNWLRMEFIKRGIVPLDCIIWAKNKHGKDVTKVDISRHMMNGKKKVPKFAYMMYCELFEDLDTIHELQKNMEFL